MQLPIRVIYVEKSVRDLEVTRRVMERKPADVPAEYVDDAQAVAAEFNREERHAQTRGKQVLLLADYRVEPIKDCPGTPQYLCCGYEILNFASGCILDCSYCILQSYFSNPLLVVQANAEALLRDAARRIQAEPERFFRLGMGACQICPRL